MTSEDAVKFLTRLSAIEQDMPLQQAKCLFIVAQEVDGMSLSDIAKKAGIGLATASRYISALGKLNRHRQEGLKLIESFEDPMERRKKIIRLTSKGRIAIQKLLGEEHARL